MAFKPDMQAVARVASRVQLVNVRLTHLTLEREAEGAGRQLTADIERECTTSRRETDRIQVTCRYTFRAREAETSLATIAATFGLDYSVEGTEPIAEADATHFAFANGAYNSWPFARELFHSMTGRLGFTPFVLPVLTFSPPRPKAPVAKTSATKSTSTKAEP